MSPSKPALLVACLLACTGSVCHAQPQLADVVGTNFDSWDANKDGVLTPDEVDRWVGDPAVTGESAAAIATIKLAMRRKTDPITKLSRDALAAVPPAAGGGGGASPSDLPVEADEENFDPRTAADLQKRFRGALRRIERRRDEAFTDATPDIGAFHQGPLGDCYFVSMVGALAYHDPAKVAGMITELSDGSHRVDFPGAKLPATVPPLTDAQIVIASTAGKDGLWLPIIENGFGEVRKSTKPEREDDEATDLIAKGGYSGESIELLTGHDATRLSLGGVPDKPLSDAELDQRSERLRKMLPGLLAEKRLVALGTGKKAKLPPGVNPSHAYAVLAFDAATDEVKIWNPHGNSFKPKGEPGLENGYPTKGGLFKVPTADLVRIFRGIVWETDKPAVPSPPRKKAIKK